MIESRSRWKWCHWDALLKCGMCGSQSRQGKERVPEAELCQSFQNVIPWGQTFQRGQQEPHTIEHLQCTKNYLDMDVKHCFSLNQTFSVFKQIQNLIGLNVSRLKYYRYVIHFLIQLCNCDSWQHPEHEDSLNKHDRSISPICNSKPKQHKKLKNTCQCPMPN